jgi:hypothetical protein
MSAGLGLLSRIPETVDLRRFRGPVAAISLVCLGMALGRSAIAAIDPGWPKWFYPSDPTARQEHIERAGSKLAAVVLDGPRPADERIGFLIGSSSMMVGINCELLEARSQPTVRWLELCCGGACAEDLVRVFRMVLWSGLKPDCIVLGLQPDMLAQTTDCLGPDGDEIYLALESLARDVSLHRLGDSLADIDGLCAAYFDQLFPSRTLVNFRLRAAISEAKASAFRAAWLGIDAMFAPARSVWRASGPLERNGPLEIKKGYFKNGRYDGNSYSVDNANSLSLAWLIDEAARRNIRLVALIAPATKFDRDMQPPQAERCLRAVLQRGRGTDPPVLNLRADFPDESFADLFHLAGEAREVASLRLAEFLRNQVDIRRTARDRGESSNERPRPAPTMGLGAAGP